VLGIIVQKWKKREIAVTSTNERSVMQIKCANCDCFPSECKVSNSAKECPNCTWDECCCWETISKS